MVSVWLIAKRKFTYSKIIWVHTTYLVALSLHSILNAPSFMLCDAAHVKCNIHSPAARPTAKR